jgi:intein/homing endonuclease
MITPHLTLKDIPLVVVNHTYKEIGMFPKDIVGGGCVVEGTKIQTSFGLKAIEDFVVGEYVMTSSGPKTVTHVWNPDTLDEGEPECFEIEFEDGYKVICSDKHKFLVNGKWIEASNLREGIDVSTL